ncbi:sirohydrochlorin chelatase [Stackebrandtia endophytica]|nr:CbiX/SirB N-terminal domain-containing protein [Stackebrandtia endophytica]
MRPPAVLVAHGSPDPRSAPVVRAIAAAAGVREAFLDFDTPTADDVLADFVGDGHRHAVMVPLLLTDAYHRRVDLPRIADRTGELLGMSVTITATVGGARLIPALSARLPPGTDAVVLAGAGSRSSSALAEVAAVAAELGDRVGLPARAAFAAAEPSVTEAVGRLRDEGARRVAVVSYFVAAGRLHDRVARQAVEAGASVTPVLGPCRELVDTIVDRYRAVSTPSPVSVSSSVSGSRPTPSHSRLERVSSSTAVMTPKPHAAAPQSPLSA